MDLNFHCEATGQYRTISSSNFQWLTSYSRNLCPLLAGPARTDHNTAYPGGGASKQIMVAIATFGTARPPKLHENRRIDPKHRRYDQDLDSCTAVDAGRRSHVLSPVFVTRTLCSILGLFRYKPEWYVVSDRTQTLIFLSNPIKYNWSRFLSSLIWIPCVNMDTMSPDQHASRNVETPSVLQTFFLETRLGELGRLSRLEPRHGPFSTFR